MKIFMCIEPREIYYLILLKISAVEIWIFEIVIISKNVFKERKEEGERKSTIRRSGLLQLRR